MHFRKLEERCGYLDMREKCALVGIELHHMDFFLISIYFLIKMKQLNEMVAGNSNKLALLNDQVLNRRGL